MTQSLRVCVIGAGLAGLACALAAAQRGHAVRVLDDALEPRSLCAHVEVVPGMLRDLVHLGVGETCVRAGFAFSGVDVKNRSGQILHQLPTPKLSGDRFPAALGIRHAELHALLEREAGARGVAVVRGARVVEVKAHGAQACVRSGDGAEIAADLVLLATGAGSELRRTLFAHARPVRTLPQEWLYTLTKRPVDLDRPAVALGDKGRRMVLVPVQNDEAGLAISEPRAHGPAASARERLIAGLQEFGALGRTLTARIAVDAGVTIRPVSSGVLDAPWHVGRVLAVGDCAHALPPHFGQAAAQAIEDARVLAELLDSTSDVTTLLDSFERRRIERARKVHEITATAARWDLEHDSAADLGQLMDTLARTVAQPS